MNDFQRLQQNQPWVIPYTAVFETSKVLEGHRDFQHALIHVMKSAGKLAAVCDDIEHGSESPALAGRDLRDRVADMVVCALRMANTAPAICGGPFDLWESILARIDSVNRPADVPSARNGQAPGTGRWYLGGTDDYLD